MDDSSISVVERAEKRIATGAVATLSAATRRASHKAPPARTVSARKRSVHLSLVLVSAAALSACGNLENGKNLSRDTYASMEACKADWGTPGDCETIAPSTGTGVGTTHSGFYGPRYYSRSGSQGFNTAARPGSRSTGTVSSAPSRGGFGASSAHHSGGSSHSSGG